MRALKNRLSVVGLAGLMAVGLLVAATGCDETAVAGYYDDGYDYDDSYYGGGYDSGDYTAGDAISTYLGNFIVY